MYLLYNYGFLKNGTDICQKYFDKEEISKKIIDEIMLYGSSLYE